MQIEVITVITFWNQVYFLLFVLRPSLTYRQLFSFRLLRRFIIMLLSLNNFTINQRFLLNVFKLKSVYSLSILLTVFHLVPKVSNIEALTGIVFGYNFLFLWFKCIRHKDTILTDFQICDNIHLAFLFFIWLCFFAFFLNFLVFVFIDHIFNSKTGLIF